MCNIPRPEHPNPQWERDSWKNLNGTWEFAFDFGCSAVERRLWEKETFDREILVPFCPESKLSGIGYTDFISGVAYRRAFTLSQEELAGKVLLHFGAVDYEATVYVNGELAGTHKGGYTSFTLDITRQARLGEACSPRASRPTCTLLPAAITPAPRAFGRRCGWSSCPKATSSTPSITPT